MRYLIDATQAHDGFNIFVIKIGFILGFNFSLANINEILKLVLTVISIIVVIIEFYKRRAKEKREADENRKAKA